MAASKRGTARKAPASKKARATGMTKQLGDATNEPVSFAKQIKGLFTARDISCMNGFGVNLDDYGYMGDPTADPSYADHANARHVYARLTGTEKPRMPKGGPYWTQDKLDLYQQWMQGGFQP